MANSRSRPDEEPLSDSALLPTTASGTPRRLLEAAVIAFAERGYHGVSVRDLTSAIGIKAGSFYAHFPSKEALLAEIVHLGHEAHQAAVRDAVLGAGVDPVDQLREGVRANVTFQANRPLLVIVVNTELHALAPENRGRVIEMRRATGLLLISVIERGNTAGVFRCADPWLALSVITAAGIRLGWWYRPPALRGDDSPLSDYPESAISWLPEADYDVDTIAEAYADFALQIVGAS